MRRGQQVFLAWVTDEGEVEVQSARICERVEGWSRVVDVDRRIGGTTMPLKTDLSTSRKEALQGLAKKLRGDADHARIVASDFTAKAERLDAQAAKALEMAGGKA